jgi:hypothetical protein
MILLVHLLFGAAIGSVIKNIPLAVALAFLSHYLLDLLPHIEYGEDSFAYIENKGKKQLHKMLPDILKIIFDLSSGILLIWIFSREQPAIYICAFFALLPDGFTVLNYIMPNKFLELNYKLHQKIHFLKHKKISVFWRIVTQVAVVIISIILLRI